MLYPLIMQYYPSFAEGINIIANKKQAKARLGFQYKVRLMKIRKNQGRRNNSGLVPPPLNRQFRKIPSMMTI